MRRDLSHLDSGQSSHYESTRLRSDPQLLSQHFAPVFHWLRATVWAAKQAVGSGLGRSQVSICARVSQAMISPPKVADADGYWQLSINALPLSGPSGIV